MIFYRLLFIFLCNVLVFSQDLEDLSFGDDSSLDIATWNIEWFPKNGQTTAEYVRRSDFISIRLRCFGHAGAR